MEKTSHKNFKFSEKKAQTIKSLKEVEFFLNNLNKYFKPIKKFKIMKK